MKLIKLWVIFFIGIPIIFLSTTYIWSALCGYYTNGKNRVLPWSYCGDLMGLQPLFGSIGFTIVFILIMLFLIFKETWKEI